MGKYDDIINLPHRVSESRPHMPRADRAAQFASFAAMDLSQISAEDTITEDKVTEDFSTDTEQF